MVNGKQIANCKKVLKQGDSQRLSEAMDSIEILKWELSIKFYEEKYKSSKKIWRAEHYGTHNREGLPYPYSRFYSKVTPVNDFVIHTNNLVERLIDHELRYIGHIYDSFNYQSFVDDNTKVGSKYHKLKKYSNRFGDELENLFFDDFRGDIRHNMSHNIEPYVQLEYGPEEIDRAWTVCNTYMEKVYGLDINSILDVIRPPHKDNPKEFNNLHLCTYADNYSRYLSGIEDDLNDRSEEFSSVVKNRIQNQKGNPRIFHNKDIVDEIKYYPLFKCLKIQIDLEEVRRTLLASDRSESSKVEYYAVIRDSNHIIADIAEIYPRQKVEDPGIEWEKLDSQKNNMSTIYLPISRECTTDHQVEIKIQRPESSDGVFDEALLSEYGVNINEDRQTVLSGQTFMERDDIRSILTKIESSVNNLRDSFSTVVENTTPNVSLSETYEILYESIITQILKLREMILDSIELQDKNADTLAGHLSYIELTEIRSFDSNFFSNNTNEELCLEKLDGINHSYGLSKQDLIKNYMNSVSRVEEIIDLYIYSRGSVKFLKYELNRIRSIVFDVGSFLLLLNVFVRKISE